MTDLTLTEALAEVKRAAQKDGPWTEADVFDFPEAYEAIATILNAVASGDLIPKDDADLAVALVVERVAKHIAAINRLATSASIASCTCGTKTPDIEFHTANCRYVKLQYILAQCEDFRAIAPADALAEVQALRAALHDAINSPKGVVPKSAEPFYRPDRAAKGDAQ